MIFFVFYFRISFRLSEKLIIEKGQNASVAYIITKSKNKINIFKYKVLLIGDN